MKTEIIFKENFFWNQEKNFANLLFWTLELNGWKIILHQSFHTGCWKIGRAGDYLNIFDHDLEFKDDAKAKAYVESKLLKWIKSIINIRI